MADIDIMVSFPIGQSQSGDLGDQRLDASLSLPRKGLECLRGASGERVTKGTHPLGSRLDQNTLNGIQTYQSMNFSAIRAI